MPAAGSPTLDVVRRAVRNVVRGTPALRGRPEIERQIAERMVRVSMAAAELLAEEQRLSQEIEDRARARRPAAEPAESAAPASVQATGPEPATRRRRGPPLAEEQSAGDIHGRTAVNSAAGVLRSTRDAIDFPGFVTSLITGVFQSITTSTMQQLQAYSDLLDAVGSSAGSFAASQITAGSATTWLAAHFPVFQVEAADGDDEPSLRLREDAEMPSTRELRDALGATDAELRDVDPDELGETLVPLARRKLARDRQSMLATMLLMGMQRVVVDEGRIHASMELQVDARSTAEQTQASRTDTRVNTEAGASFGVGAWGASARMSATVGYVRSNNDWSREDIAVRAGLQSSVDVTFRTDQIPLDRMASRAAQDRLRERARVPEAERQQSSLLTGNERQTSAPEFAPPPEPRAAPDPGSQEERDLRARQDFGPSSGGDGGGGGDAAAPSATEGGGDATAAPPAAEGGGEGH
jgi:hypothetical protein